MKHGYSAYSHGCRCATCLVAKRTYQRELRARKYTTAKPAGTPGRPRLETPAPKSIIQIWKDKLR